jgi:hypothetical protein
MLCILPPFRQDFPAVPSQDSPSGISCWLLTAEFASVLGLLVSRCIRNDNLVLKLWNRYICMARKRMR